MVIKISSAKKKIDYVYCMYTEDWKDIRMQVFLVNKQAIWLTLRGRIDNQFFDSIFGERTVVEPLTDGERIYWPAGPSITYDDIVKSVVM